MAKTKLVDWVDENLYKPKTKRNGKQTRLMNALYELHANATETIYVDDLKSWDDFRFLRNIGRKSFEEFKRMRGL